MLHFECRTNVSHSEEIKLMTHPEKNAHAALCDKNRVIKARKSASLPQRC
jgi:hypothetical protein